MAVPFKDKERQKEYKREWNEINKDKVSVQKKEYRQINKDKVSVQQKEYRQINRDRILTQRRGHYQRVKTKRVDEQKIYRKCNRRVINKQKRERYANDICFKLVNRLRGRLNFALSGVDKSRHTLDLLGVPINVFKTYIECMFTPGMTWENHGKFWQLHHIKSFSSFNLSDPRQQEEACNFENIRPVTIDEHKILHGTKLFL